MYYRFRKSGLAQGLAALDPGGHRRKRHHFGLMPSIRSRQDAASVTGPPFAGRTAACSGFADVVALDADGDGARLSTQ
jgi:hypothetical protein